LQEGAGSALEYAFSYLVEFGNVGFLAALDTPVFFVAPLFLQHLEEFHVSGSQKAMEKTLSEVIVSVITQEKSDDSCNSGIEDGNKKKHASPDEVSSTIFLG